MSKVGKFAKRIAISTVLISAVVSPAFLQMSWNRAKNRIELQESQKNQRISNANWEQAKTHMEIQAQQIQSTTNKASEEENIKSQNKTSNEITREYEGGVPFGELAVLLTLLYEVFLKTDDDPI